VTNRFRFWLPSVACGKPRRCMTVINNNNHNHSIIIRNSIYLQRNVSVSSVVGLVLRFDGGGAAVTAEEEPKCNYETNYCPNVVSPSCILWYTYIPIEILDFRWRRRREWMIIDKSSAQASWEAVSSIRIGRYKTTMSYTGFILLLLYIINTFTYNIFIYIRNGQTTAVRTLLSLLVIIIIAFGFLYGSAATAVAAVSQKCHYCSYYYYNHALLLLLCAISVGFFKFLSVSLSPRTY